MFLGFYFIRLIQDLMMAMASVQKIVLKMGPLSPCEISHVAETLVTLSNSAKGPHNKNFNLFSLLNIPQKFRV